MFLIKKFIQKLMKCNFPHTFVMLKVIFDPFHLIKTYVTFCSYGYKVHEHDNTLIIIDR
jgi:hypothetical protein